ncbi:MAG: acyl-CoA/acyl-ACP dehydrogenase [Trichodesmium sp. St15_bin1_1]|nr:acyl-CoA/acyl-ACP dehydrogenase [Trichodesmium sp. St16_bin2-tuft]MDE5115097.1 acyl-CoA/acyl-ACP dehydrogenase [Trichodesmium sp. St15_bin1_1]
MKTHLIYDQQVILDRLSRLTQEQFASHAVQYDKTSCFPAENFEILFREGLHAPAVPVKYGGLGLGYSSDLLTLWMMTRELGKVDLAFTRCWEGHTNIQVLLTANANEAQKQRWFEGIVKRGEKWAGWSGEPLSKVPSQTTGIGTTVKIVEGGYIVDGSKVFATGADGLQWAILFVNTAGAGGARHHNGLANSVLMLACDLSDPSVSFDSSWWKPIGMRASVSYRVQFDRTFIPQENLIGYPGQYLLEEWQTRFTPQYGAAFLGAAEGAYAYALAHIKKQGREKDAYVQHRIAQSMLNIETMDLWLRKVASLWETGQHQQAKKAGNQFRYLSEKLAMDTLEQSTRMCGARAMIQPSPLERIYRDLSFYTLHENCDRVLASIGQEILEQESDRGFFNSPGNN